MIQFGSNLNKKVNCLYWSSANPGIVLLELLFQDNYQYIVCNDCTKRIDHFSKFNFFMIFAAAGIEKFLKWVSKEG